MLLNVYDKPGVDDQPNVSELVSNEGDNQVPWAVATPIGA